MKTRLGWAVLLGVFFSTSQSVASGWTYLQVATWNINGGMRQGSYSPDIVASQILRMNASVVALQEVNVMWELPCKDNMSDLVARIGSTYPYSIYTPSEVKPGDLFQCGWGQARRRGIAVFSKYPIIAQWSVSLPSPMNWTPRVCQVLVLQVGAMRVGILATHLQNNSENVDRSQDRLAEAELIAQQLSSLRNTSAVFLAGDFNATFDSPELAPLRIAGLESVAHANVVRVAGGPLIDQVWYRNAGILDVSGIEYFASASDHYPVVLQWGRYFLP